MRVRRGPIPTPTLIFRLLALDMNPMGPLLSLFPYRHIFFLSFFYLFSLNPFSLSYPNNPPPLLLFLLSILAFFSLSAYKKGCCPFIFPFSVQCPLSPLHRGSLRWEAASLLKLIAARISFQQLGNESSNDNEERWCWCSFMTCGEWQCLISIIVVMTNSPLGFQSLKNTLLQKENQNAIEVWLRSSAASFL